MATTTYGSPYVANTDLVSAWPGVSLNVAQRVDAVSYAGNGVNAQTGTTYTLVLTDAGKNVTLSNASAVTVTIPAYASVAYAVGTVINLTNLGAGTVTVAASGGVTLNGSPLTLAQYTQGQLLNTGTNTWVFTSGPAVTSPGLAQVTPASIANSGGSASLTGPVVTFTGVTSVSLNSVFTSTYDNYRLILTNLTADASRIVNYRLRASGTDSSANSYAYQYGYFSSSSTGGSRTGPTTAGAIGYANTSAGCFYALEVAQPQVAQYTTANSLGVYAYGSSNLDSVWYTSVFQATNQFDGITIYSAGTISGTLRVYGYKN